jgi:hypothetical protein
VYEACDYHQQSNCALVSRTVGEDPVGTATPYHQFLLVELPLPWPKDITTAPAFPPGLYEVLGEASKLPRKVRFLFVAPDPGYSVPGRTRVLSFRRPAVDRWTQLVRDEFLVPPDDVVPLARELLHGPAPAFDACRVAESGVRDLLVCTHGSTDVACGQFGNPLYRSLRSDFAPVSAGKLRVWRASHLGGHRFAPTVLDLPEARYWAHLAPAHLEPLVRRTGSFEPFGLHYRGWGALDTPWEQAAEREVLVREGWPWLGRPKSSRVEQVDPDGTGARVRFDLDEGSYTAAVHVTGTLQTLGSSRGDAMTVKQYRVDDLRWTPAPGATGGFAPCLALPGQYLRGCHFWRQALQ